MRVRHKVPSIFSLSMVDMLCCALGCVILIWLLNAKMSEDEAEERRQETETILAGARADREASQRLLAAAREEHHQATSRVRALEERLDLLEQSERALKKQLASEQEQAKTLAGSLKDARGRIGMLQGDIRAAQTKLDEERKKSGGLDRTLSEREADLRKRKAELAALQTSHDAEKGRADALDKSMAARRKELDEAKLAQAGLEKLLKERQAALDESGRKLTKLERDKQGALDDALKKILMLTKESADAKTEASRLEREKVLLRLEVENRFAGITLTGKRVIFLIDASGSMVWLDEKTKAPQKWTEVCATVAKLMRSLPQLEKFQLVTFNNRVDFPLGSAGRWLDYNPKTSPDLAQRTLAAVTPTAGTNMYSAVEAAFRYRELGLDAVYLLSDGLPNEGEGVEEAKRSGLQGVDRSDFLGKKVRAMLRTNWNRPLPKQPRVKVNTIGFFYESPDLGAFLWALARENDGSFVGMSRP